MDAVKKSKILNLTKTMYMKLKQAILNSKLVFKVYNEPKNLHYLRSLKKLTTKIAIFWKESNNSDTIDEEQYQSIFKEYNLLAVIKQKQTENVNVNAKTEDINTDYDIADAAENLNGDKNE